MASTTQSANNLVWLYDRRIAKIIAPGTRRVDVDQFAETLHGVFNAWPVDKPYLLLFDLSKVGVTPYSLKVAGNLTVETPKYLKGRAATLIPNGYFGTVATNALSVITRPVHSNIAFNFFQAVNEEAALDWLRAYIP